MNLSQLTRRNYLALGIGIAVFCFAAGNAVAPAVAADTKAADAKTKDKVDLNTASEKELAELPGVGDVTAKKIIAGRPYKSIAPALAKAGVSNAEIAKLKGLVTFSEAKSDTNAADKMTDKKSDKTTDKMTDKGKTPDNGKMAADSKMADKGASSKMDAKSDKDAMTKSADKMASTDKMAKSSDKPADKMEKDKVADKAADKIAGPKVDLNTASEKELDDLPGVGPATAKKIVAGRPYKSVEELSKAGVADAEITKIKSLVMVSEVKAPAKADKMDTAADKKAETKADKKSADSKMSDTDKAAKKEKDKSPEPPTPAPTDKEIKDATAKKFVWANLNSKVYHEPGDRWYGKTHHGKFMAEDEAKKEGYTKAHMNENSDETKGTAK